MDNEIKHKDQQLIEKWIRKGIDSDTVKKAKDYGKQFANDGLSTSQIRNVFGEARRIQLNGFSDQVSSFLLLKPKMAYAVKRDQTQSRIPISFYEFFVTAYNSVDTDNIEKGTVHFKNFMELMEAVLAYHKFYERKK
jgi:CRISPR-associated protein Csm2